VEGLNPFREKEVSDSWDIASDIDTGLSCHSFSITSSDRLTKAGKKANF
jgi:hypothetical protein